MSNKPTDGPDLTKDDWDWEDFLRWKAKYDERNKERKNDDPIQMLKRRR
jgi:hypothetical protein